MKTKTIFSVILSAFIASTAISCADMLDTDSESVVLEDRNTLNHTYDTVYSLLGIFQRMQAIADRTVVLGEIRGDLVTVTDNVSEDLRDLYRFDFANLSSDNKFADPIDYYAVINNCNYFLANADTTFYRNQQSVFLKEYISVLSLRAWTYLQLAQVYGRVYFVDQPITSGDQADESKWDLVNIKELATRLARDFEDRFMYSASESKLPHFTLGGNDNDNGKKSQSHKSENMIVPVRLILGDLYLWAEEYAKAATYYYEYLYYNGNAIPTGTATLYWNGATFAKLGDDTYSGNFGEKATPIAYIAMESEKYAGTTSNLPNIFNSTEDNHYYPQLTYSKAMVKLSARQQFCYHRINALSGVSLPIYEDKRLQTSDLLRGDLRLQSIFEIKAAKEGNQNKTNQNSSRQTLKKINSEKICLYRTDLVYLRLAEALNRAGMPNVAFGILKYGLTSEFIEDSISQTERNKLVELGIVDDVASFFPYSYFDQGYYELYQFNADGSNAYIGNNKENPINSDYTKYRQSSKTAYNQIGIHSRGSGDAAINEYYRIKVTNPGPDALTDTIRAVEEMIIDEMALETCFEGYRFGDLMRVSMHRASDAGYPGAGGESDNDFLATRVASRDGATLDDPYAGRDNALYDLLLGTNPTGFNKNWFLRFVDTKD